jgi:hypothetical protein
LKATKQLGYEFWQDDGDLKLVPKFAASEIIPLGFCIFGLLITSVVAAMSIFGIFYSLATGEWISGTLSLVFALVFGWIAKALALLGVQTGPRHLLYSEEHRRIEITFWGWKRILPISRTESIAAFVEVNRGGFKSSPGAWFWLVFRSKDKKLKRFFVTRLRSMGDAERSRIREVVEVFGKRTGLNVARTRIQEV